MLLDKLHVRRRTGGIPQEQRWNLRLVVAHVAQLTTVKENMHMQPKTGRACFLALPSDTLNVDSVGQFLPLLVFSPSISSPWVMCLLFSVNFPCLVSVQFFPSYCKTPTFSEQPPYFTVVHTYLDRSAECFLSLTSQSGNYNSKSSL